MGQAFSGFIKQLRELAVPLDPTEFMAQLKVVVEENGGLSEEELQQHLGLIDSLKLQIKTELAKHKKLKVQISAEAAAFASDKIARLRAQKLKEMIDLRVEQACSKFKSNGKNYSAV